MILIVALACFAQPASQPSANAHTHVSGGLLAQATIVCEQGEGETRIQESWTLLRDPSGQDAQGDVRIELPKHARDATLDTTAHNSRAKLTSDASAIIVQAPTERTNLVTTVTYFLRGSSGTIDLSRKIGVATSGVRLVLEDKPGISISANRETRARPHDLSGARFLVWDLAHFSAGESLSLVVRGLPTQPIWMKAAAFVIAFVIASGAMIALRRPQTARRVATPHSTIESFDVQREQLLVALALLEKKPRQAAHDVKEYNERRSALLHELALVLSQMSEAKGPRAYSDKKEPRGSGS